MAEPTVGPAVGSAVRARLRRMVGLRGSAAS